jgi:hypothetical protein
MAIDYIIDYSCIPKDQLSTRGIVDRLKGEERARAVIRLFRENGDERPPSQMGFEFTRSTPEGQDETRVIVVQELLDAAAELIPYHSHCIGCPANRTNQPFGCIGFVQYPITSAGERWLLDRLPVPDDTLVWMLLRQGVKEFKYDGAAVRRLRQSSDAYFEDQTPASRRLGEFSIDADQVFEMIFGVGDIYPNHAAMLLMFLNAIDRRLEADEIMKIAPPPPGVEKRHAFNIPLNEKMEVDRTIAEFVDFLHALYIAWTLNVRLIMDV